MTIATQLGTVEAHAGGEPLVEALARCEEFNAAYPDETRVIYRVPAEPGGLPTEVRTSTRGMALLINGQPRIHLNGIQGAVPLADVIVGPISRWVRVNRERRTGHWLYGEWDSHEALLADIQRQRERDPRITSVETRNTRPSDC